MTDRELLEQMLQKLISLEEKITNVEEKTTSLDQKITDTQSEVKALKRQLMRSTAELKGMDSLIFDELERVHEILDTHMNDKTIHKTA